MRRGAKEEGERWLIHAKDEFQDADELRMRNRFYLALFHFQQSAEKALKAYLYTFLSSEEVFFTHSISELIQLAGELDADFEDVKKASKLDQYYNPTRYPNSLPGDVPSRFYSDPEEALDAMYLAKKVIELVERKIEGV
ncbi:MAG: HEPN domain-containing protein [Methanomicrobia archaeon]|nr:HEPN domain-containing protein [Methanomicrobia archaeon]